jgi:hypothetical protein
MFTTLSLVAAMSAGLALAQDQPNTKPAISPAFDFAGAVDRGLMQYLEPTWSEWDQWGAGWIPADCKRYADHEGYPLNEFEVFNVHYWDCNEPWIMCRHRDSRKSQVDMIDVSRTAPCLLFFHFEPLPLPRELVH